ncbi:MAG: DUF308 domain-containing protein [Eubacteriales bacterium]|nr:DUF308 domain-containing protein [Eubacteriales bacterium]
MFETFRSIRVNMVMAAVGCLALGIALLVIPDLFLQVACYVTGAVLIAYGVLSLLGCVREHRMNILTGFVNVVAIGVGIFIITQPKMISSILPIIFGLILLLDGILNLRHGIGLHRFGDPSGKTVLVLGIITVLFGAVILFHPYSTAKMTFRVIGIALVYSGLSDFLVIFRMNRANRTYENQKIIDVEARPVTDEEEDS